MKSVIELREILGDMKPGTSEEVNEQVVFKTESSSFKIKGEWIEFIEHAVKILAGDMYLIPSIKKSKWSTGEMRKRGELI